MTFLLLLLFSFYLPFDFRNFLYNLQDYIFYPYTLFLFSIYCTFLLWGIFICCFVIFLYSTTCKYLHKKYKKQTEKIIEKVSKNKIIKEENKKILRFLCWQNKSQTSPQFGKNFWSKIKCVFFTLVLCASYGIKFRKNCLNKFKIFEFLVFFWKVAYEKSWKSFKITLKI